MQVLFVFPYVQERANFVSIDGALGAMVGLPLPPLVSAQCLVVVCAEQGCGIGVGVGVPRSHGNEPGVGVGVGVDQTASAPTPKCFV